jgi:hypothetical protein
MAQQTPQKSPILGILVLALMAATVVWLLVAFVDKARKAPPYAERKRAGHFKESGPGFSPAYDVFQINGSSVNVYQKRSESASVIAQLNQEDSVALIGNVNGWALVEIWRQRQQGYIKTEGLGAKIRDSYAVNLELK